MMAAIISKEQEINNPFREQKTLLKFKVRDLFLLKNPKKQTWDPKFMPNFYICKVINDRVYDFQDPPGHDRHACVVGM